MTIPELVCLCILGCSIVVIIAHLSYQRTLATEADMPTEYARPAPPAPEPLSLAARVWEVHGMEGVFSSRKIWDMADRYVILPETMIRGRGDEDWLPLSAWPELLPERFGGKKHGRAAAVVSAPAPAAAQPEVRSLPDGLERAGTVFLCLGAAVAVVCGLMMQPMMGAMAGGGPITLGIVLFVIGRCLRA